MTPGRGLDEMAVFSSAPRENRRPTSSEKADKEGHEAIVFLFFSSFVPLLETLSRQICNRYQ